MARPRRSNILEEFERVKKPDFQEFSKITAEAIGSRKAYEFAQMCGVNASTISRILNWQNMKSPISDELLVSIAANSERNNGDIFGALLNAHGLAPRKGVIIEDYGMLLQAKMHQLTYRAASYGVSDKPHEIRPESQTVRNAREIIQNDLLTQGLRIRVLDTDERSEILSHGILSPVSCDFALEVTDPDKYETTTKVYLVLEGSTQKMITRLEQLFSTAYLIDPLSRNIKICIVLFDQIVYERLKDELKNCQIPDEIMLMYLNVRARMITSSFQIPVR